MYVLTCLVCDMNCWQYWLELFERERLQSLYYRMLNEAAETACRNGRFKRLCSTE